MKSPPSPVSYIVGDVGCPLDKRGIDPHSVAWHASGDRFVIGTAKKGGTEIIGFQYDGAAITLGAYDGPDQGLRGVACSPSDPYVAVGNVIAQEVELWEYDCDAGTITEIPAARIPRCAACVRVHREDCTLSPNPASRGAR